MNYTTREFQSQQTVNKRIHKVCNLRLMPTERPIDIALRLAKSRGWNQTELANRLEVSSAVISNWKARGMPAEQHERMAERLEISVDQLLGRVALTEDFDDFQMSKVTFNDHKVREVFVVGKGSGGFMPDRIWTDSDFPVGATDECAPIATNDIHAFLTAVDGTSMVPRYNPGEFALVEPGTDPDIEDDVLVRLATGHTMIKRLLSRRGGWRFGSYNDPEVLFYGLEEVSWVYYIAHPVPRRKIKARC